MLYELLYPLRDHIGPLNVFRYISVRAVGAAVTALLVAMSLFHLYGAARIVPAYILRPVHVAFALGLSGKQIPTKITQSCRQEICTFS